MVKLNLKNKILYFRPFRIITLYLSMLVPKKQNLMLFGSWFGEKYADNSRYLYEYIINKRRDISAFWLTSNDLIYSELKKNNMPVCKSNSLKAILLAIMAKYIFYCTDDINDIGVIPSHFIGNAICINLWHGVGGGKKIGYDDTEWRKRLLSLQNRVFEKIEYIPLKQKFFVCTSDEMKKVFRSAFRLKEESIIMAGQPRNDMFYNMNYQIGTIDVSNLKGRKVITYMPTHRKTGAERIDCSKLFDLKFINEFCKENRCIFIIKKHFYHKHEIEQLSGLDYILDWTSHIEIDTNELLMLTDFLITDYSSVATDYLLLDRPVLYYCFDLEHYLKEDRDVYWDYDSITPGPKAHNFDELRNFLVEVLSGKDDYKLERKRVRDMFYDPSCQCEASGKILTSVEEIIKSYR